MENEVKELNDKQEEALSKMVKNIFDKTIEDIKNIAADEVVIEIEEDRKKREESTYDVCEVCLVRRLCEDIKCRDSKDKPNFASDLKTILRGNY